MEENFLIDVLLLKDSIRTLSLGGTKYIVMSSIGSDICQIGDMTISMLPYKQVNCIIRLAKTIDVPPRHLMTATGRYHHRAAASR